MADKDLHDWEVIARAQPFFGVLTSDEYRPENMTPAARENFYQSGEALIEEILAWFDTDLSARPTQGAALDIGCGVGRLTSAMAKVIPSVTGYDISETMLAHARIAVPENVTLTSKPPVGPFSWISSFIVFQHIPPTEGLALLDHCLAQCAPECFLSLHITVWRDPVHQPPYHPVTGGLRAAKRTAMRAIRRRPSEQTDNLIRVYDYNLSDVIARLNTAGFKRMVLRSTDHGGHHGVWIISHKA